LEGEEMPEERKPLSAVQNGRNHSVTAVVASLLTTQVASLGLEVGAAGVIAAALVGAVVGFLGSVSRSYTAAGGTGLAASVGKRLAGWIG
jgi:hypothetical protein